MAASFVAEGTVTVLRLTDADRQALWLMLLTADQDGDSRARGLIDQLDEAYRAAIATAYDEWVAG